MARPVTLFTGQWADLPLEHSPKKPAHWGFDGLELACWGDHFEVDRRSTIPRICRKMRDLLKNTIWAVGQLGVIWSVRRSATRLTSVTLGILPRVRLAGWRPRRRPPTRRRKK